MFRLTKGFRYGYEGLNVDAEEGSNWMWLDPKVVESIHHFGGSLIGTSRGPQPVDKMVQCLRKEGVSILFTIGGDGTLRGTKAICDEIARQGVPISVIGIPKTIDNDVPLTEVACVGDSCTYLIAISVRLALRRLFRAPWTRFRARTARLFRTARDWRW